MTRSRGQFRTVGGRNACIVSVAGGRFDREIERFEGLGPVGKSLLRLSPHHPPVVALRLPPANGLDPSGIAVRAEAGPGQPSKSVPQALQPRIGKIGPIGQEPAEHSTRGARSCVSKPRLALIRVLQSFVARSDDLGSACCRLCKRPGDSPHVFLPVRGSQRWIPRPRLEP